MSKVTTQDIADALKLSRITVSKALNSSIHVSPATRQLVFEKAREMGYARLPENVVSPANPRRLDTPHAAAAREIAILTPETAGRASCFSRIAPKLYTALSNSGICVSMHSAGEEKLAGRTLPASLRPERVTGVICAELPDRAYARTVCSLGLPVLLFDGPGGSCADPLPADLISMDNTTGIARLVGIMLAHGKKRIGFIGDYGLCWSYYERYAAFCSAMMSAGAPVNGQYCIKAIGEELPRLLKNTATPPELFICADDALVLETIQTLRSLGRDVPKDILISGFGDTPEASLCRPPLTTVRINPAALTKTAAELLAARIQNPASDYRIVYTQTELIIRESTANLGL